jgi:hypothetical protein
MKSDTNTGPHLFLAVIQADHQCIGINGAFPRLLTEILQFPQLHISSLKGVFAGTGEKFIG